MMKHILVHALIPQAQLDRLATLSQSLTVMATAVEVKEWAVPNDLAAKINIILTTFAPANLDQMPALELMQIGSVGYAQLAGLGLPARGIRACNARGIFDVPIAEWNIAMMINLTRDLRTMIRHQETGTWAPAGQFQQEVRELVVGIWGYGGIGRETARLCRALGLTVHVLSRSGLQPRHHTFRLPGTGDPEGVLPDRLFTLAQKEKFLSGLDFLIVAMPLTGSTRGIIGQAELAALPPRAFVLNPARGPIIAEEALLWALRGGRIAGAALDTHYAYPLPADHPLWQFPNVIMTPHISGSSLNRHYPARLGDLFVENVGRLTAGQPLLNEITAVELNGDI
jgi:phosphoglycerate dehydrogenase-like enzyme